MSLFDLTNKVAIITGASSGLGADAARSFVEHGADVALFARRKEKLDALADELKESGSRVLTVQCDVSVEEQVKSAVEQTVEYFSKIDILINNAGIAIGGSVEQLTLQQWQRCMDINVTGIYLMCKYVIPHMKAQNYGKIVNVGSVNAVLADKEPALARHVYNTSKAAVRGLTMGMAASYMQNNITVNSVGPGLFESEMTENTLFANEGFMKQYNSACPASRPARRGELNGTLIYLSSDASSYVTSQHILVDGGVSIV